VGSRIVIAAAGAVDHQQLVDLVSSRFGSVAKNGAKPVSSGAGLFTGSEIRIRHDLVPKAHAAIAFAVAGHNDPDSYALQVIQHMLGSWEKSTAGTTGVNHASYMVRQVAREELAEKLSTFIAPYSDIGLFGVYTTMDWMGQHELLKNILYAITDLSYNADELELTEGKQQALLATLSRLESPSLVTEDIGRHLLAYGRRIHPLESVQRLKAVDMEVVKAVAQRFFLDRDPAVGAIGPIYEFPDYNWLRARTYFRRL
jgi:processing peptidase subunit beta